MFFEQNLYVGAGSRTRLYCGATADGSPLHHRGLKSLDSKYNQKEHKKKWPFSGHPKIAKNTSVPFLE